MEMWTDARASVVIPAHNESTVVDGCLEGLCRQQVIERAEVVVVANGCSDDTAAVARRWQDRIPGLKVVETDIPSKANALNLGDASVTAFPRVFLDADIVLSPGALDHLVEALSGPQARVASPHIVFDKTGADAVVRSWYHAFERLPYVRHGLIGLGVYAVSAAGRARFGAFPDLTADDLFVQRLFAAHERLQTEGEFRVVTPRAWQDLLKVRTRAAQGSRELADQPPVEGMDSEETTGSTIKALARLALTERGAAMPAAVYVAMTVAARALARRKGEWKRDESSRQIGAHATTDPGQNNPGQNNTGQNNTGEHVRTSSTPGVAYLVSQYPALSHTFIEREVVALRKLGLDVQTFSVRRPPEHLQGELMRTEAAHTTALQADVKQVLGDNWRALLRRPGGYLSVAALAAKTGDARLRARVWQVFYLAEAARLYQAMKDRGLRHVHAHFANNGADVARLAVELGKAIDGPQAGWRWSFTMHGPTEFEAVDRYDLAAKVASAAGIACIADFTRSQLMRLSDPADWPKMSIVRMSVDAERYPMPATPRDHDGPLRVLNVGRLVPEKGGPVLIDALAQLRERGIDFQARMIGGGDLHDSLAEQIERLGLADRIELVGPVGQDEILAHYHWADVFCLPSFQEGLPVVLMEALATGIPVVTTRIAGIGELVLDGVNGRLLSPGRADLVCDALAGLANDPELRDRMGRTGRQMVVEEFSVETNAKRQRDFMLGCRRNP